MFYDQIYMLSTRNSIMIRSCLQYSKLHQCVVLLSSFYFLCLFCVTTEFPKTSWSSGVMQPERNWVIAHEYAADISCHQTTCHGATLNLRMMLHPLSVVLWVEFCLRLQCGLPLLTPRDIPDHTKSFELRVSGAWQCQTFTIRLYLFLATATFLHANRPTWLYQVP